MATWRVPDVYVDGVLIPGVEGEVEVTLSRNSPVRRIATFSIDVAIDTRPDACWRCDAAEGETNVGLCASCHADLTAGQ